MQRLLTPGWIARHLFALTIFATLIFLAIWQLDRLEQRRAANAERLAILEQNPTTLTPAEAAPAALAGRLVRVTGTLINEESVVLRNQRNDLNVNGLHLLTPLRIAGSDRAVIIDRGWISGDQVRLQNRLDYTLAGELTIVGIARPAQFRPDAPLAAYDLPLPGQREIEAWLRVDIAKLQQQIDAPLLPIFIQQLPTPDDDPLMPRPPDPRRQDEGPHLGYALQWGTFAGMLAVVYGLLIRQELQKR